MDETINQKHILIVDDEPLNLIILTELLEDHFRLTSKEGGGSALADIQNNPPDLILLDIVMPDINGLEVCKKIRADDSLSHIPIIFLSALDKVTDKMAGYEAGGDDYIAKPFSGIEVLTKIKLVLNKQQELSEQKQQSDNNMQMAMTLMSQTGETGHVLHFLKDSFLTKSIEELCQLILDTCTHYDLKTVVRANTSPPFLMSHSGKIKPIDKQILDTLHMRERLIYFGSRCLVNFDHISLLIKNMPIDDDDKNGRLKDHIALIMEAADARMVSLQNEIKLADREKGLSKMLSSTQNMLNEIETDFNENANKNAQIMSDLGKKIEWNFVQLGLSDEQESELSELVEDAINDSISLYQTGLSLDKKLTNITDELKNIMDGK